MTRFLTDPLGLAGVTVAAALFLGALAVLVKVLRRVGRESSGRTIAERTAAHAGRALVLLAVVAAWLSYASVRAGAIGVFGPVGGSAFPILLDTGVFVSSEFYLATVRANRPQHGFRALTHALIAATIALNVSVATDWRGALFHAIPPMIFAALVELKARKELGDTRAAEGRADRIPLRLWLTSPVESVKLSLWVARDASFSVERASRERYLTARRALRIAVPGWRGNPRLARGLVRRQLRAGTLDPAALVAATGLDQEAREPGAEAVLQVALVAALTASGTQRANAPRSAPRAASGVRTQAALAAGGARIILPEPRRTRGASEVQQFEDVGDPLAAEALRLDEASIALGGGPISMRQLKQNLGIGQARATDLRAWLDGPGAEIAHANGSAV
jgi:Protein of unknown function (DUF2637)